MKEIVIMRFILSVLMLLASVLASVGAVNYPARTNGNNTFYGNISALGRVTAGASGGTNSIGDDWSRLNNFSITNGSIQFSGVADTISSTASIKIGKDAGKYSTSTRAIYFGVSSGEFSTNSAQSVYLGYESGRYAAEANQGIFIGSGAGRTAFDADQTIAIGVNAGWTATNSDKSIFIGQIAGQNSQQSQYSVFIGNAAGQDETNSNRLIIDSRLTTAGTNGLIYGEFDNRLLRVNGNLDVTNTIFGMRPFGSLMLIGNENLNLASSGTFYQVVNYDVLSTNYFASSLANGTLTNLVAGYYKIDITCSFDGSGGAADLFESSVFTNTTECATVSFHRKTGSADTGSAASSGILYLPANCRIDARFRNTGATGTIVLRHYNLTVTMQ